MVEIVGVEPTTSCMPCKRSSQLSYTPIFSKNFDSTSDLPDALRDAPTN